MVSSSVWVRGLLCAASAVLLLAFPAMAASEHPGSGVPVLQGTNPIASGQIQNADGYLLVAPDAFGSWAALTFGGGGDLFNPDGPEVSTPVAFSSGFLLFVGTTQRELLAENASWQGVFPDDTTLDATITSPSVPSDTNSDTVDDTLVSQFIVTGGSTALTFDLTQTVAEYVFGLSSTIKQTYVITNDTPDPISFILVRAMDADLLYGAADFADDEVGTSTNGAGLGPYVFQQEATAPSDTAVTLSGLLGGNYYGGKHGVEPGNGPPPYNYGTDVDVWDAYGVPTSWESHVAGVGYFTNGVSGPAPPGSTSPEDGFIGMDFAVSLAGNEQTTVTVIHTYGQNTPADIDQGDGGGDGGDDGGDGGGVPATTPWGVFALFALILAGSLYFMRKRASA